MTKGMFRRDENREVQRIVAGKKTAPEPDLKSELLADAAENLDAEASEPPDHKPGDINAYESDEAAADQELEYTDRQVKQLHLKEKKKSVEYVGLISQGVFDEEGNLASDTFRQVMAGVGREQKIKRLDTDLERRARRSVGFNPDRNYDIYDAGLDLLPRNTCRPTVIEDSPKTQVLYEKQGLSPKTRDILQRTNYRKPYSLKYCRHDDDWIGKGLRPRSSQVMINLLHVCMDRGDYERSWRILTCILRESHIEARMVWMIALELLEWKDELASSGADAGHIGDKFLDWLIINFPSRLCRPTRWRSRPRATELVPFAVLAKLARGDSEEALAQVDELVTISPYSSDPICWALCGLASSQAGNKEKTQRCFQRCVELGGEVPDFLKPSIASGSEDSSDENS